MDYDYEVKETTSFSTHLIEFIQTLAVFAAIGAAIYYFIAQPHKVSGRSMHPTFKDKDYIMTDKVSYRFAKPQKGDMVVFKNPRDESQDFIKRIIAVPGDTIKIQNYKVYVNGEVVAENYLQPDIITSPKSFLREGEEILVKENHYIVLGDNRQESSDSREWGPITKQEIIGKVFFRYWPWDNFGFVKN